MFKLKSIVLIYLTWTLSSHSKKTSISEDKVDKSKFNKVNNIIMNGSIFKYFTFIKTCLIKIKNTFCYILWKYAFNKENAWNLI